MRTRGLGLALSLVAVWPVSAAVPTDNPLADQIDRAVDAAAETFFADRCHVGLSIGILDRDQSRFYNYGATSKSTPQLPTRRSLYEIGSVTKTFVGALAARALLDGTMDLDADFRAYLGEPYPNLEQNGKPITLRSLATHTSGLPRDIPNNDALLQNPDFEKLPYQLLAQEKDYDTARYLRELHDTQLRSEPGAQLSYSNIGIKLIGFGLEHVSGQSFERLLQQEIFEPLEMRDIGLILSADQRPRLVQGHTNGGNPAPHILPNAGAAGGLISSTEDLIKYARWQLDERDPVVAKAHETLAGSMDSLALGLIWDMTNTPTGRKLWHSGGVFGMSSQFILFPDSRQAFALLANDGCFDTQGALEQIALGIHRAQHQ